MKFAILLYGTKENMALKKIVSLMLTSMFSKIQYLVVVVDVVAVFVLVASPGPGPGAPLLQI